MCIRDSFFSDESVAQRKEQMEKYREVAQKLGSDAGTDIGELLYDGKRTEVTDWLGAHGWKVTAIGADELMAGYGRTLPSDVDAPVQNSVFVEGRL